jgi:hypothetical protein
MAAVVESATTRPPVTATDAPVVVDLGKKSRKQIRQLRKGEGKLLDEVQDVVARLKAAGTVDSKAQPLVIVVRQKRRRTTTLFPFG